MAPRDTASLSRQDYDVTPAAHDESRPDVRVEPVGALVIPVYNEECGIARLLTALHLGGPPTNLRVVVVCNGCQDRSAEVARTFPGTLVAELEDASKTNALNVGDRLAGDVFPRLYVDADVHVDHATLRTLLSSLARDSPLAAGPSVRYLTEGKPWSIRSFYCTMDRLPKHVAWQRTHLAGRGIYGTNRAGRTRFGAFPDIRNDDAYFDLIYDEPERLVVEDATVGIEVPDDARDLIRSYTRVHDGNLELRDWLAVHQPDRSLWNTRPQVSRLERIRLYVAHLQIPRTLNTFRRPRDMAMFVTYVGLRAIIAVRCSWNRVRGREIGWR